jgi:hypothetical protein
MGGILLRLFKTLTGSQPHGEAFATRRYRCARCRSGLRHRHLVAPPEQADLRRLARSTTFFTIDSTGGSRVAA